MLMCFFCYFTEFRNIYLGSMALAVFGVTYVTSRQWANEYIYKVSRGTCGVVLQNKMLNVFESELLSCKQIDS